MDENKDLEQASPKRRSLMDRLRTRTTDNINSLYKSTYYSDNENKTQLQLIKKDISNSIRDIMDNNNNNVGAPNISKLYERLFLKTQNDPNTVKDFEAIFGNNEFVQDIANSYLDNRWVRAIDQEIDEVLRYMPKLEEALQTIRDNVLSSDSFSKDYLTLESYFGVSNKDKEQFSRNIDILKNKYELLKNLKDWYYEISKYGEVFVYCVPYQKALQRLMDNKISTTGMNIATNYGESSIIIEESDGSIDKVQLEKEMYKYGDSDFDLHVDLESGIISSIVKSEKYARDKKKTIKGSSITEQYFAENGMEYSNGVTVLNENLTVDISNSMTPDLKFKNTFDHDIEMGKKLPVHHNFDNTLPDDLDLPNDLDISSNGLVDPQEQKRKLKDMNGCIVRKLDREKVTPIILNDVCLGYYYFEFDENQGLFDERYTTTGMVNTITGLMNNVRNDDFDVMHRRELLLRNIASKLSDKIDHKFIDANQDLKKEIYYILKYNDDLANSLAQHQSIRVSYIPPEDIHHMYFKLDTTTGRGITDLALSLIPAKLYVAIYVTNCLAIMTRGNDKRVYYVRQTVETNISKSLLKTINEIKKSNFNIRQVENINSVLNITGRFNDYIIPRGPDGQSPIEFEVMPGQQVEIKTDLLNILEESAINPTGVPIEIIQNRQSPDYAMQLTMSNSKFLRFVYDRQSDTEECFNPFLTKLYDIEFGSTDRIKTVLPPPLFINVTNTNQLIVNTNDYAENVGNIVMADEQNEMIKAKFLKEYKLYCLGSYLRTDIINKIIDKAKQETIEDIVSNPENLEQ